MYDSGADEYGPGTEYTINTEEPYKVSTHFATSDSNKLDTIRTTLIQGENTVYMELECDFTELSGHLDKNMAMAISTYSLDASNNDIDVSCSDVCNSGST